MNASRKAFFSGSIVELALEQLELPNGHRCELEIERHPGGATVVALEWALSGKIQDAKTLVGLFQAASLRS